MGLLSDPGVIANIWSRISRKGAQFPAADPAGDLWARVADMQGKLGGRKTIDGLDVFGFWNDVQFITAVWGTEVEYGHPRYNMNAGGYGYNGAAFVHLNLNPDPTWPFYYVCYGQTGNSANTPAHVWGHIPGTTIGRHFLSSGVEGFGADGRRSPMGYTKLVMDAFIAVNDVTDCDTFVGISTAVGGANDFLGAAHRSVGVLFQPSNNANWQVISNDLGVITRTTLGVPWALNQMAHVHAEIGGGVVKGSVNASGLVTHDANVGSGTNGLVPFVGIMSRAGTANRVIYFGGVRDYLD